MAADTARLVEYLVRALVDDGDAVEVKSTENGDHLVFEVTVAPDDVGKVIGRQGRIVKAIRTIARAAGSVDGTHVDVEILG